MSRKCLVVTDYESRLVWDNNGEHSVIENKDVQEHTENSIPVHPIHCGKEATEYHDRIYARWYGGAHGSASPHSGIYLKQVDLAYCPEHNQRFLEEQNRLKVEFEGG